MRKRPVNSESLASRVKILVDHFHGGSINDAAKALDVAQPTVARIVKGTVLQPRSGLISRMSEVYGVSTDWLLKGTGEPPSLGDDSAWYRRWRLFVLSFLAAEKDSDAKILLERLPLTPVYAAIECGAALGLDLKTSEELGEIAAAEIAQAWRRMFEAFSRLGDRQVLISSIQGMEEILFPRGPSSD